MILIHVITKSLKQAIEIADFLTEKQLILNSIISKDVILRRGKNGKMVSENRVLLIGKTKSLLFNEIDRLLKEKHKKMPILYSLPITQMDWEQSDFLIKQTIKI